MIKIINAKNFIAAIGFALLAPFAAQADAMPNITMLGISNLYPASARVQVSYDPNGMSIDYANAPILYVQYMNISTNETFSTGISHEYNRADTPVFEMQNLVPGTQYSYQAILSYKGQTVKTESRAFKTPGGNVGQASSGTTASTNTGSSSSSTAGSSAATSSNTSKPSPSSSSNNLSLKVTVAKAKSTIEENVVGKVATGGVTHSNGVVLYVSDEHARVYQDDPVTFTVKVQNTHSYVINDASVEVTLPDQYEYASSGKDADYDSRANIVTYYFGRIAPQATETFTFKVDAVGEGKGTVETTATLTYDGGRLSATDHDAYSSDRTSVLGATVFGAGFFPSTFLGWFVILLLITVIIIAARRYRTLPKLAEAK